MIQNYIFDLYGTLVDIRTEESAPSLWRRMALLLSFQGADYYAPEELRAVYRALVQRRIDLRARELPHIPREHIEPDILPVFRSLYENKGVRIDDAGAQAAALFFRTLSMGHLRLYPRVKEVLRALRARSGVYLLSNAQAAFTLPELHKLGLSPLFDGIVLSSDVGVQKPDKAIFRHILSRYGLSPDTCLMVGNDAMTDMAGAAAVGMAGRYIHTKQSPARQGPLPEGCKEIQSLLELL